MTTIQARAIVNAREEFVRARKELERVKLTETSYRGIPTVIDTVTPSEVHGTFIYRGHTYTKW